MTPRRTIGRGGRYGLARILAYVARTVDQELLARNEYLAAENRILKGAAAGSISSSATMSRSYSSPVPRWEIVASIAIGP
jgi:hypothetical protein